MAGSPLTGLTARGKPIKTDLMPIETVGGTLLQSATMGDLADFVLTSVKTYGAVGDGVTDDTVAIQAAITSGLTFYFPPGVYVTSSTLNVTAPQNDGQVIRGSGSYGLPDIFNGATGYGAAVIKPTSAVTTAILIDGTPFVGGGLAQSWVQGFGMENIAIDMANMTDIATTSAIKQVQAWDCHFNQVRIRNDGVNKRGWLYKAGAFTTLMQNTQCHIIEMAGNSPAFGVTTVTIINHDGGRLIGTNMVNLRVIGGAFQGPSETKFYFRQNSASIYIATDVEGTGTYLDVDSTINNLHTDSQLQGFAGTYMAGTPGVSFVNFDQQTNFNSYPFNLTWGYINLNNQGAVATNSFYSGATGSTCDLRIGRTGLEALFGTAANANDYIAGTAAGDSVISSWGASQKLWIGGGQVKAASATSTGFNTFGSGTLNQGTINNVTLNATGVVTLSGATNINNLVMKPTTDGQQFLMQNAAGQGWLVATSNATVGNSLLAVANGANIVGYSDNGSTLRFNLNAQNGFGTFQGLGILSSVDGANFTVYNVAAVPVLSVITASTAANSTMGLTGSFSASGSILSAGATGVGYATGAGGTVTQATSKATGVTLNKTTGAITLNAAALTASTSVMFTLTNSTIAATDLVDVNIKSGATSLAYLMQVEAVAAGSANIVIRNVSAGSLSEAVVLTFAVIKGATS